ncbi:hypothetical protein C7B62_12645 [Pleurocapsa sp. CCALA 161]|uniref:hypothetical protein n=1 Tax=Pleurocapsa sp. CCALA 161 TaxID=2107688 RepID=UPI000D059E54|nr:hypothetical protein [Pleurocapsa sp. CCALA 161]PSB09630.1 hypothetical protein C7B62_12645 [Pleurocapsa sp. CCALA 161]
MKYRIITLTLIASALIPYQAQASSPECEQAIKDTNFIYTLIEDHVYFKWAMKNDPNETIKQKKIIDNNARSLEKYCQLTQPSNSQIQVRMNFINQAWDNIKRLSA